MRGKGSPRRLWAPWRMAWIEAAGGATAAAVTRDAPSRAQGRAVKRNVPAPARRAAPTRAGAPDAGGHEARPCLFCRVRESSDDRADLVLARRARAFLMLNRFPYNPGHLMVAVAAHKAQFHELDAAERADLLELVAVAEAALARVYRPHGVNYGANFGTVAGAGFPGHLHVHLVPRWNGDTNFMPVVAETRVLPESLGSTWRRLRAAIAAAERRRRPGGGSRSRAAGVAASRRARKRRGAQA